MTVNKVLELMAESDKSWEDATQLAVAKAAETVKGIRSVWVKDFAAKVDGSGKVSSYRVTCKVTFGVER